MKPSNKLNLYQETTIDSWVLYVWCPEDSYQGGVGHTTYLVSRKSHRAYMKHTRTYNPPCMVNSNQVAHLLLVNGHGTMPTKPKCPALPTVEGKPSLVSAFSEEEYRKGIAALKNNKAACIDDILVEQLKNLGPNAYKWLHTMFNTCFIENTIPKIWKQSKIIAILKPGKDSAIPKNYRPISLMYKLYKKTDLKQSIIIA